MSYKAFVRFALWCGDTSDASVRPAGPRLHHGDDPVKWPRELLEKDGRTFRFVMDDAGEACDAAKALEAYLNGKKK